MRKELKNFNWHTYGLESSDIDYTFQLVNNIISDRNEVLNLKIKEYNSHSEKDEIISDISHYNFIENQYLWSFAIWRIQAIFEGILKQNYFPDKKILGGFSKKIDHAKDCGFHISNTQINRLKDWKDLRNALSHLPPEQYRPVNLNKDDLLEFVDLTTSILKKNSIK